MYASRPFNRTVMAVVGCVVLVALFMTGWSLWPAGDQSDSLSNDGASIERTADERTLSGDDSATLPAQPEDDGSRSNLLASQQQAEEPPARDPAPKQQDQAKPASGRSDQPAGNPPAESESTRLLRLGSQEAAQGNSVAARALYTQAMDAAADAAEAGRVRERAIELAQGLLFSPTVVTGDEYAETYVVKSGDSLVNIAKAYAMTYPLLQQINGIADPKKLRVGQKLKVIKGPFSAIVTKSQYRIDIYLGDVRSTSGARVLVASYRVGLGQANSTPVGDWIVRKGGKLSNPAWTNPRTGEQFSADDPKNPIGEYWLSLEGTDATTKLIQGMGIHGTIDPASIGSQASMGCVRLGDGDVEAVYNLLSEGKSTVLIRD